MRLQKRFTLLLFTAICACAAGGKKIYEVPKNATGGAMSDVKVMRLGTAETGEISDGPTGAEGIVSTPIVLWQKGTPAEVILLHYKTSLITFHVTQRFKRVMSEGGPFTITHRALFTLNEKGPDVYSKHIYTADLDGNGTEELILTRVRGEVEAYSLEKKLFSLALPKEFQPKNGLKARIGNRDVVFVMFGSDEAKKGQQKWIVVRVDEKGAVRLPIGDANNLPGSELVAVAPINRPGSSVVDELVVVSSRPSKSTDESSTDKSLVRVSRYNVDGKLLYTPREVEVPDVSLSFRTRRTPINISFLPHSEKLVLFDADGPNIYFIEPQQQQNWIRTIDLHSLTSPSFVQVVDYENPKVILRSENRFFAVDEMGKSYSWDGKLVAQKDLLPFLEIKAPSNDGDERVNVLSLDNGSPEILVVRTSKKERQLPKSDEVKKIAAQYLGEDYVAQNFIDIETTPDGKIDEKSTWVVLTSNSALDDLATALKTQPGLPEREKLKIWLESLNVPAKTIVEHYRGNELREIQAVRGYADDYSTDSISLPYISSRKFGNKIQMVIGLSPTGETKPGNVEMGGIYLLEWQEK